MNDVLIIVVMLISFCNGCWWLICDVTGPLLFRLLMKVVVGLAGAALPIIYFLDKFQII